MFQVLVSGVYLEYVGDRSRIIVLFAEWILIKYAGDCDLFSCLFQLDCGIHPGLEGMDALPYIDLIDPAEIDLLLISQ